MRFPRPTHLVICCQHAMDAQRIKESLGKRLNKYRLSLNEEKTKLVSFSKQAARAGQKQGTFDFLGFTFYLGRSQRGFVIPREKTSRKRFKAKLKRVNEWAKGARHKYRTLDLWKIFCAKLRGHIVYYSLSTNLPAVSAFQRFATRIVFKWLNRRSQRRSFNWKKFEAFMGRFPLPEVKAYVKFY